MLPNEPEDVFDPVQVEWLPARLEELLRQLFVQVLEGDVVLGQVSIQNCVLSAKVSAAGRRNAAAASKFSIVAGEIDAQDVAWKSWKQGTVNVGFKAQIDTAAAKFQSTPAYIAQIIGSRALTSPALVVAEFVSVINESPTGFTLQLALPAMSGEINPAAIKDPTGGPALMKQLGWRVSWMGVEG